MINFDFRYLILLHWNQW